MTNNAVILMSGGLDSLVALGYVKNKKLYDSIMALTFDYGQKAAEKETEASKNICNYYGVEHKIIKLDWLKEITKTALVSDNDVPEKGFQTTDSTKAVWVPNRNALFLNIAGSFCDAFGFKYIIYGGNLSPSAQILNIQLILIFS